jgi:hypothetical protein
MAKKKTSQEIYLICGPDSSLPDDIPCECCDCGCDLFKRPHATKEGKAICIHCAIRRPDFDLTKVKITQATRNEVEQFLRKKLN